jgi:very-short-patch-repair endonuclease
MDAPKATVVKAKCLRRAMTLPEVLFWAAVRSEQVGLKFRRQHPFGPYILDFYCDELKLAVEIDGSGHDTPEQMRHDARRTAFLEAKGLTVYRLAATDVLRDLNAALEGVALAARNPPPAKRGGGGPRSGGEGSSEERRVQSLRWRRATR